MKLSPIQCKILYVVKVRRDLNFIASKNTKIKKVLCLQFCPKFVYLLDFKV